MLLLYLWPHSNSRGGVTGGKYIDYGRINERWNELIDDIHNNRDYNTEEILFFLKKMPQFKYKQNDSDLEQIQTLIDEGKKLRNLESKYKKYKTNHLLEQIKKQKDLIKDMKKVVDDINKNNEKVKEERREYHQVIDDLENDKYVEPKKI